MVSNQQEQNVQYLLPRASTVSTTNSLRIGKRYKSSRKKLNKSIMDKSNCHNDEQFIHQREKKAKHTILVGFVI